VSCEILAKYVSSDTATVCGGCKLKATKPEAIADKLVEFVALAAKLDGVKEDGGRFSYPDGLTLTEWTCLEGLRRGRNRAEKLRPKPK
jgi:hypothetical protein